MSKFNINWALDIKEIAEDMIKSFESEQKINKHLREENNKLKRDIWAQEEFARLNSEIKDLKSKLKYGFIISKEEYDKIEEFKKQYSSNYCGAISGEFEYRFIPTSIGTVGVIIGPDKKEFIFREIN